MCKMQAPREASGKTRDRLVKKLGLGLASPTPGLLGWWHSLAEYPISTL